MENVRPGATLYRTESAGKSATIAASRRRQTISLGALLQEHDVSVPFGKFANIYEGIGEELIQRLQITDGKPALHYQYRVDTGNAVVLMARLYESRLIAPPRSEEERVETQRRLLRVRVFGTQDTYRSLTFDEVTQRLQREGMHTLHHFGFSQEETEDILAGTLEKMLPYLQGRRGDFDDILQFQRFFHRALKRKRIDHARSQDKKRRVINVYGDENEDITAPLAAPDEPEEQEYDVEKQREILRRMGRQAGLSEDLIALLEARSIDKLSYNQICALDRFKGYSNAYLRKMVTGAKNALDPNRPKAHGGRFYGVSSEALVAEYKKVRDRILKTKGKLPSSHNLENRYAQRSTLYTSMTYALRFGNGSWTKARERLEEFIAENGNESLNGDGHIFP